MDADCGLCGYVGSGFRVSRSDTYGNQMQALICPECEQVCETYANLLLEYHVPGLYELTGQRLDGRWVEVSRKAPDPLIPPAEQERLDALPAEVDPDDPATWPEGALP